jgi:DNA-binding MarR family transcriptional regulator
MRSNPVAPRSDKTLAVATNTPKGVDVGPLADKLGYVLRLAQLAVFEEYITAFAAIGLRPAQYGVLVLLQHAPGMKQSDVAAALGIQRANFVALCDGLEQRGLAHRCPTPKDRRSYALYLTERCQAGPGRAQPAGRASQTPGEAGRL